MYFTGHARLSSEDIKAYWPGETLDSFPRGNSNANPRAPRVAPWDRRFPPRCPIVPGNGRERFRAKAREITGPGAVMVDLAVRFRGARERRRGPAKAAKRDIRFMERKEKEAAAAVAAPVGPGPSPNPGYPPDILTARFKVLQPSTNSRKPDPKRFRCYIAAHYRSAASRLEEITSRVDEYIRLIGARFAPDSLRAFSREYPFRAWIGQSRGRRTNLL